MVQSILNLFLKANCALCGRPAEEVVCRFCKQNLQDCQRPPQQQLQSHPPYPLLLWGQYDQSLKRAIAAFKYDGKQEIGALLGQWLGESWHSLGLSHRYDSRTLAVLPIPLHPAKLKQRGFNQAAILARTFAQFHNYRYHSQGLVRVKSTQPLFELTLAQRQREMDSALKVGDSLNNLLSRGQAPTIIIVDDIYTTGTTVDTAIQVLTHQGFKIAAIVAIASSK